MAGNLLLDTHVFLWWRLDDPALNEAMRTAIATAPLVFVSAASVWEASIKAALGKLEVPEPFDEGVAHSGFERLPIGFSHGELAGALPRHHRDPFDRMLIAQAKLERLTIVTHDPAFKRYDVKILWVSSRARRR